MAARLIYARQDKTRLTIIKWTDKHAIFSEARLDKQGKLDKQSKPDKANQTID
jgi:hypothetical protein